jgi:hypothetical protein
MEREALAERRGAKRVSRFRGFAVSWFRGFAISRFRDFAASC